MGWTYRLLAWLTRPPAIRPLTDADRELIRAEYRARMALPTPPEPISRLPWDQWLAASAERQARAR